MIKTKRKKIEMDAARQSPGRLATKVATVLIGKHKASYQPHIDQGDKVSVLNIDQMVFTGKKLEQKEYKHHTMHPGGLKHISAKMLMAENPEQVLRYAVIKMLPKNKFRTARMRRLSFK